LPGESWDQGPTTRTTSSYLIAYQQDGDNVLLPAFEQDVFVRLPRRERLAAIRRYQELD
jgi:hypothetical protein